MEILAIAAGVLGFAAICWMANGAAKLADEEKAEADPGGVLAQAYAILESYSRKSVVSEAERIIRGG